MSFFKIFDVAGTALSAQQLRLNVVSSNLANAEAVAGDSEQVYRARHPIFASLFDSFNGDGASTGVRVDGITESNADPVRRYQPDHPLADDTGHIYLPNVNIVEEMANMISAARAYQNNIEVMNTAKQLMIRTLSLGR